MNKYFYIGRDGVQVELGEVDKGFFLELTQDGLFVQFYLFGYRFNASIDNEPMFGVGHPDGRYFGFWTEDFEFDRYPSDSAGG